MAVPKHKLDQLILNYFIQEGFQAAAIAFANEIGVAIDPLDHRRQTPPVATATATAITQGYLTIIQRKQIKRLILQGHITEAIATISQYFPLVLDANNLLHFKLLRLNLIEMIRTQKQGEDNGIDDENHDFLSEILAFVREHLITKVLLLYKLLHELEVTMLLLCFRYDPLLAGVASLPVELRGLFDLSMRTQCYRLVNRAILSLSETTTYLGVPYPVLDTLGVLKIDGVRLEDDNIGEITIYSPDDEDQSSLANEITTDANGEGEEPDEVDATVLELKLERVVKLWAVTEQRIADLNIKGLTKPAPVPA